MKRYVVLGVNENPKYLYYLPLVVWAWRYLGWEPITFVVVGNLPKVANLINMPIDNTNFVRPIDGYKTETIAQVSRLFGARQVPFDSLLMTSDVDMLPLSDYWKPNEDEVTTYGRDLTDYHFPICYIAMHSKNWYHVMNYYKTDVVHDLELNLGDYYQQAKNKWCVDQDIITDKLLKYGKEKITHINRGTDKRTGYPLGRVDRSNWRLDHAQLIDAHLPHDVLTNDASFHKVMELLHHCWPKEDFKWFINYHREFKKLL